MNRIFIDIETLPCEEDSVECQILKERHLKSMEIIKAPSNYGEEAAAKFVEKKRAEAEAGFHEKRLKTALDGALGQILCIGYAINDEPAQVIREDHEYYSILAFIDVVKSYFGYGKAEAVFVGHNILDFDLRFLYQRAVITNAMLIQISGQILKPSYKWNEVHDTMKMFSGFKGRISQDHLARLMGLPGKPADIDGSNVYAHYQAGKIDKIIDYCKTDVEQNREIYKRMV